MKIIFQALLLVTLAMPALSATQTGETLTPFKIENQFGEAAELNSETQWVIFSADMDAAKMMTPYLNENASKLDLSKTLIISDISKMPAMISKMFAIPKMKKYAFKLALDRTGENTKPWPRQSKQITVMKLTQLKVDSIEQLSSTEAVQKFFADKKAQ